MSMSVLIPNGWQWIPRVESMVMVSVKGNKSLTAVRYHKVYGEHETHVTWGGGALLAFAPPPPNI